MSGSWGTIPPVGPQGLFASAETGREGQVISEGGWGGGAEPRAVLEALAFGVPETPLLPRTSPAKCQTFGGKALCSPCGIRAHQPCSPVSSVTAIGRVTAPHEPHDKGPIAVESLLTLLPRERQDLKHWVRGDRLRSPAASDHQRRLDRRREHPTCNPFPALLPPTHPTSETKLTETRDPHSRTRALLKDLPVFVARLRAGLRPS